MKKLMNRKGFTLVELLAVIVILAVIILVAMNAVIPQMEKARKNAFITEAVTYVNAAKTWYTAESIKGSESTCVDIGTLSGSYVEKSGSEEYAGHVTITKDGNGNSVYTISISNGSNYLISEKTLEDLSGSSDDLIEKEYADASGCTAETPVVDEE